MFSGKIDSYKGYIKSKKVYLKRKKQLNRELRVIKQRQRLCKSFGRRYYQRIIDKGNDDIYILRIMYNYYKKENKRKK